MRSTGYNPQKQMIFGRRVLALLLVAMWMGAPLFRAEAQTSLAQPAADLAKQIAAIAGPGPAKLTIQNSSSLNPDELPNIRALLERDLNGYGVIATVADSATTIRVTLSENSAGGLWVAEVREGTEERVAMVPVVLSTPAQTPTNAGITLRKTLVWQQKEPVLDLLIVQLSSARELVVLEPERIVSYVMTANTWAKAQEFPIAHTRPFPRDARGRLVARQDHLFDAYLPGVSCTGAESSGALAVSCADSDDPWPIPEAFGPLNFSAGNAEVQQKAFYNMTRNYFTGVLSPGFGMQLQPFYDAAAIARPNGTAMLLDQIDGRVVVIESNITKPVAGARDWGSDFAAIHSACGAGTQILVSGSGATPTDSVRAYEIPGREAEPVSAPLAMDGQITVIWPSKDGTSATVVVRAAAGQNPYEVYVVSALCN